MILENLAEKPGEKTGNDVINPSKFHILSMCPCVVATVHPNSAACQPLFAPGAIHLSQTGIASAPGHTAPGEKSHQKTMGISQPSIHGDDNDHRQGHIVVTYVVASYPLVN